MTEMTATPDVTFEFPSYSKPGRILVEILGPGDGCYRYEAIVHSHDDDSSVFYMQEGIGFEFFLDDVEIWIPGWYVIENIVGHYHRGDGWTTDDTEEWEWGEVRPATPEEIRTETLD